MSRIYFGNDLASKQRHTSICTDDHRLNFKGLVNDIWNPTAGKTNSFTMFSKNMKNEKRLSIYKSIHWYWIHQNIIFG